MDITDFAIIKALAGGGGGGGGGITPEQLATYIKNNTIKNVSSIPSANVSTVGNVIYNRTDNKIYRCENIGTVESPVYGWVEKLCLAIEELPTSDIPQTLDNDKKFYLTKESFIKDGQAVTNYQLYKLSDIGKDLGFSVNAEGIVLPDSTITTWEDITSAGLAGWQELLRNSNAITGSTYQDAEIINGNVNNAWFVTYIGNVSVTSPKLLYEDKNGVQVVVPLSSLEQILQDYQSKITAGAGLVFDGNTLKHSNHVTSKPQRFIRATAYDAEGHAINFGADYLVSRTDNNDDALSDSYLSSTLWVHKHYSPIEASSFINKDSIPVDDCVFNMMDIGDSTLTRRSQKRYIGLANFTNPITNSPLYGGIDVTEYWYTYLQEGTGTCMIEQVFKNSYNGSNYITFKRFGTLTFGLAGEYGTAIYTNRASIVWKDWVPIDYPSISITKESPVSEGSITFVIKSGMGVVRFSALTIDEFLNPSAVLGTLPAGIQVSDARYYIGDNNGDMHILYVRPNGNLQLWKKTGDVFPLNLSGTIIFPIG